MADDQGETPKEEKPAKRERDTEETVTLWAWRGCLLIAIVLVFAASLMAAWGVPAGSVFASGVATLGLAVVIMWVRGEVFGHR
jgi:small-conductance mechanosensitive channel